MLYQKRICGIGAIVLFCFMVTELIVTGYYNTSPKYVSTMVPYRKSMPYENVHTYDKNSAKITTLSSKSDERFEFNRLQKMFKDKSCIKRKLIFRSSELGYRTALVSFPASGNTWTRHLIHQLTGFFTCEANKTIKQGENVSVRSANSKACIVYKSHHYTDLEMEPFKKAVILIRDPLYALKSYFHYLYGEQRGKDLSDRNRKERHTGYASTSLFLSPKWTAHVTTMLEVWKENYVFWFKYFRGNCMVIVYEDMKEDIVPELLRIARFLGVRIEPRDLWCTLENKEGGYRRISRNISETGVFNLFTAKQKEEVHKAVCQVSDTAKKQGIALNISQYLVNLSTTHNTECL